MNSERLVLAAALFVPALLGHLIGDYLLQSKWMAITKSRRGMKGVAACTVHVLLYTAAVCGMLRTADPLIWFAVGVPHWLIDRWSLGGHWLRLIRGRTVAEAKEPFEVAFFAVVYTVADNTLHLLCLWALILYALA